MSIRVGRRYPDFVIPNTNKAVEVYDSTFLDRGKNGYREKVLADYASVGWKVLPLEVRPGISDQEIVGQLTEFALNGQAVVRVAPISEMGRRPLKDRAVYDLTCDPYPTFFANGLLVHNCSWCDTLYAVLPEEVKKNSIRMTVEQIVEKVNQGQAYCEWVTLSGGNPLLHDLGELVDRLHEDGWQVAVETQGTIYREWVQNVDLLVVSPKPPSSGMTTDFEKLSRFMSHNFVTLKIVVFDDEDFEFAVQVRQKFPDPEIPLVLQVGNHVGTDSLSCLVERLRWLVEKTVSDKRLFNVRVLPQLHVWLWGNKKGV